MEGSSYLTFIELTFKLFIVVFSLLFIVIIFMKIVFAVIVSYARLPFEGYRDNLKLTMQLD